MIMNLWMELFQALLTMLHYTNAVSNSRSVIMEWNLTQTPVSGGYTQGGTEIGGEIEFRELTTLFLSEPLQILISR